MNYVFLGMYIGTETYPKAQQNNYSLRLLNNILLLTSRVARCPIAIQKPFDISL